MVRLLWTTLLLVALVGVSTSAEADCRASASGSFSARLDLSPLSGRGCFTDVRVFSGATCGPSPQLWGVTVGCGNSRFLVVTDRGRLVSLMAPRASRRAWDIVTTYEYDGSHVVIRGIPFGELPGLPATARRPRLAIDATALRILVDPVVTIAIPSLETLGHVRARRRIRRP